MAAEEIQTAWNLQIGSGTDSPITGPSRQPDDRAGPSRARLAFRVITRLDQEYPERYHQRLKEFCSCYAFLCWRSGAARSAWDCSGRLSEPGCSRTGMRRFCRKCLRSVWIGPIFWRSQGCRYDQHEGSPGICAVSAVSVLAEGMEKTIKLRDVQKELKRGDLCLLTPYSPDAGFSVGGAMGRNRLIYCLADYAIVVASDAEKGGTWSGASEALRFGWLPVFVLEHSLMPEGNRLLIQKGAHPFPHPFPEHYLSLAKWLHDHSRKDKPRPTQMNFL